MEGRKRPKMPLPGTPKGSEGNCTRSPGHSSKMLVGQKALRWGVGGMARDGTGEQVEGLGEHGGLTEPVSMLGAVFPHI